MHRKVFFTPKSKIRAHFHDAREYSVIQSQLRKYKQTVWLFRPGIRGLFVESGILGFGTRNPAQGFRDLANNWNPETKSYWQRIRNPCSTWTPESKTVLDYLTWGEVLKVVRFSDIRIHFLQTSLLTLPMVLIRRICAKIYAFYTCWSFFFFSWSLRLIEQHYGKENSNVGHSSWVL